MDRLKVDDPKMDGKFEKEKKRKKKKPKKMKTKTTKKKETKLKKNNKKVSEEQHSKTTTTTTTTTMAMAMDKCSPKKKNKKKKKKKKDEKEQTRKIIKSKCRINGEDVVDDGKTQNCNNSSVIIIEDTKKGHKKNVKDTKKRTTVKATKAVEKAEKSKKRRRKSNAMLSSSLQKPQIAPAPLPRLKSSQKYLATCGRGMHSYVAEELKERFDLYSESNEGRVFFETDISPRAFLALRTVERIVCLVVRFQGTNEGLNSVDPREVSASIAEICRERGKKPWQRAYKCWNHAEKIEALSSSSSLSSPYIPPSFLVNAKLRGGYRECGVDGRITAARVSNVLKEMLAWKPEASLRYMNGGRIEDFQGVEIYLHANDHEIVVGLPLFRSVGGLLNCGGRTLAFPGLRPTTAWLMAKLANIEDGDLVVDATMGVGAILIEAARSFKHATYIGGDCDLEMVSKAKINIEAAGLQSKIEARHWDVTKTGIRGVEENSVHRVLADLPFGLQHGSQETNRLLYPEVLSETERIMKLSGLAVFLTSDTTLLKETLMMRKDNDGNAVWEIKKRIPLQMGEIHAEIFVVAKLRNDEKGWMIRRMARKKAAEDLREAQRKQAQIEAKRCLSVVRQHNMVPRSLLMSRRKKTLPSAIKKRAARG